MRNAYFSKWKSEFGFPFKAFCTVRFKKIYLRVVLHFKYVDQDLVKLSVVSINNEINSIHYSYEPGEMNRH